MSDLSDRPTIQVTASDLELLRCFEPVIRFTQGEGFYPTGVEPYVRRCSLWIHHPDGSEEPLVPEGQLTMRGLVEQRPSPFGAIHFLRFVPPLSLAESREALAAASRLRHQSGQVFQAGAGRLTRGGLLPRLVDAGFSATLLLRGTVPAVTAAAAQLRYHAMAQEEGEYVYHGRVVRQGGWTILQYWFFYAYNSWRSGYHGVNDHESDWEMIVVYLYEADGRLVPEWIGYASHDFHGADLRRRWDDGEELELVDGHPVVYAGAGSHASYFRPGEYQAEVNLAVPGWVHMAREGWRRFWVDVLGQPDSGQSDFHIPFVDYARGDGLCLGPEQLEGWTPVLISEDTPWVSQYRGLWGLYARDPISGENAPAGPMYNRDGSPRPSWFDPLGFAGLDQVPPPPQELALLAQRQAELRQRQEALWEVVAGKTTELQELGAELKAMEGNPHLAKPYHELEKRVQELSASATGLLREQAETLALLDSLSDRIEHVESGAIDDPRAHVHHLAAPVPPATARTSRVVETWAAVSISLLLLGIAVLVITSKSLPWIGIGVLVIVFVLVEALLRGRYETTVATLTAVLALITAIVLVVEFWKMALAGVLIAVALFLLGQKARELRG